MKKFVNELGKYLLSLHSMERTVMDVVEGHEDSSL